MLFCFKSFCDRRRKLRVYKWLTGACAGINPSKAPASPRHHPGKASLTTDDIAALLKHPKRSGFLLDSRKIKALFIAFDDLKKQFRLVRCNEFNFIL